MLRLFEWHISLVVIYTFLFFLVLYLLPCFLLSCLDWKPNKQLNATFRDSQIGQKRSNWRERCLILIKPIDFVREGQNRRPSLWERDTTRGEYTVLRVSMGGENRLPTGNMTASFLPKYYYLLFLLHFWLNVFWNEKLELLYQTNVSYLFLIASYVTPAVSRSITNSLDFKI